MSAETLHVISLFSGIGGIDLAFERARMTTALLCERDKHATAVLNHHWPHIPVHPDVSELTPDDLTPVESWQQAVKHLRKWARSEGWRQERRAPVALELESRLATTRPKARIAHDPTVGFKERP